MLRGLARQLATVAVVVEQRAAAAASSYVQAALAGASSSSKPALPTLWALQAGRLYSTDPSRSKLFTSSPHSLEYPRMPAVQQGQQGLLQRALLTLGGFYSKESTYMRAAQGLYAGVVEQATNHRLLEVLGVPDDFQHSHSMLCLHIWLLLVRLRPEGKDGKMLAQALYDDFQSDVEARAREAGVKVRLQKQLTELEKQFYGSSMAYDKAMQGGSEELWAALHRNVFMLDPGKADAAVALARYIRRELACLTLTPSEHVMAGNIKFSTDFLNGSGAGSTTAAAAAPVAGHAAVASAAMPATAAGVSG